MTDRRSDRPASRTIRAGQSCVVHGVRINCVKVDGDRETVRLTVWRETECELSAESATGVDIPRESATN